MKKLLSLTLIASLFVFGADASAAAKKAAKKPVRKPNPAMAPIEDVAGLPRVLLIGDSISIGYTLATREALAGKANLHRIPANGGPTTSGLANIDKWLGDGHWDVIHFNWGLHDLKYMGPNGENLVPKEKGGHQQVPPAEYEKNLAKLVKRLQQTKAKLIWRNTTPVPPGAAGRVVGDSVKYNEIAAKVMKKHGIPTHDLYTMSKERMEELMLPANVHYKPEGSIVLGQDVARVILDALKN
ncbi:MAG: SGNH/GDSL hydrolase family protein [Verrucomicrobiae bacterium]|jgi:hypothetical protein|nr:SGNH/GDSL hydrolase family protein [Verrucomicrobiae bacterium]